MALFDKKDDIFKLIEKFEESSVMELELESGENFRIRLSKVNPAPVYLPNLANTSMVHVDNNIEQPSAGNNNEDEDFKLIRAPIIGTFYSAASPESEPYVKVGDKLSKGAVVCILEAMKVMNEIECEQDCEILEILAVNGDMIEYNQPLFKIR